VVVGSEVRSMIRFASKVSAAALVLSLGVVASAGGGCGSGSTDYHCDSTGCFDCDGYTCTPVTPAAPTPCTLAGDPACKPTETCTDQGCLELCKGDADCPKGTVCRGGLCASPIGPAPTTKTCTVATDCGPSGFECIDGKCAVAASCSGSLCSCKYSSDCGVGRICVDSKCAVKCDASTPCAPGFTCSSLGTCVEGTPVCGAAAAGASCQSGQHCVDGHCAAGCAADGDCKDASGARDASQKCSAGACVPNDAPVATCGGASDCASTQKCVDGFCRFLCSTNDECLAHDVRIGACSTSEGFCRDPKDLAAKCTSKSDCTATQDCVDGACK